MTTSMRASGASAVLPVAVALGALLACSQGPTRPADDADTEAGKQWKEIAAALPAYPRNENLLAFYAGSATPHRFYVDVPSLAIGEDGVWRYTLVTRTAGGATNVTFEGIRCDGRGHKYYAVGESNGTWTPARNPQWRRIPHQGPDQQRVVLIDDYFCEGKHPRKSLKEVLNRLRDGPPQYQF